MARIDEVNLRILQMLQTNGRASFAEIATAVGRSESTVRERVAAMELDGLLMGYQARIDWSRVGLPAHAVLRARCEPSNLPKIAARLQRMGHVTAAYFLTGPKPVFAMLRVRDMQHLHSILRDELQGGDLWDLEAEVSLEILVENRPPTVGIPPVADLLGEAGARPPAHFELARR